MGGSFFQSSTSSQRSYKLQVNNSQSEGGDSPQRVEQMAVRNRERNVSNQGTDGVCWAFAISDAIKALRLREKKRFNQTAFRKKLIKQYGKFGQDTSKVLEQVCERQNLQKLDIEIQKLYETLIADRVVVATYHLYENQWRWISEHFKKNKRYILRLQNLENLGQEGIRIGHAVVIVGAKKDYFYVKNSWGKMFGTDGYFRIARDVEPTGLYDIKGEFDDEIHSESSGEEPEFKARN